MKKNTMKKLLAASLSLSLALSLAACSGGSSSSGSSGSNSSGSSNSGGEDGYKVAIVRQLDHASMNEIRDAITAELNAK